MKVDYCSFIAFFISATVKPIDNSDVVCDGYPFNLINLIHSSSLPLGLLGHRFVNRFCSQDQHFHKETVETKTYIHH